MKRRELNTQEELVRFSLSPKFIISAREDWIALSQRVSSIKMVDLDRSDLDYYNYADYWIAFQVHM